MLYYNVLTLYYRATASGATRAASASSSSDSASSETLGMALRV